MESLQFKPGLILIDGNSLLHRAFYALPDMRAKDGTPTGALVGFLNMLIPLIKMAPDGMLVAFDMHGPTFRHLMFSEYKAGRKETPEDLKIQFPLLKAILKEMGICIFECEGYEADDILGTMAKRAEKDDINVLIVSGDRDGFQLVSDRIHLLLTKKGISESVEYSPERILEQYGLSPDSMKDLKGLMGDSSDNIPGIPGVGEKTALNLLKEYGTLENVLEHGECIKGKLGEKVLAFADSARLSYRLGTIDVLAPVNIGFEDCRLNPDKVINCSDTLKKYGMFSVLSKLEALSGSSVPDERRLSFEKVGIKNLSELQSVIKDAQTSGFFAFSLQPEFSFCTDTSRMYYISSGETLFDQGISPLEALTALDPVFKDISIRKITFDVKTVYYLLEKAGIRVNGNLDDCMILEYLIDALHSPGSIKELVLKYCGVDTSDIVYLLRINNEQRSRISNDGMDGLYSDIEMPLSVVLYEMERTGFLVDSDILHSLGEEYAEQERALKETIYEMAGEEFNILSPKQLGSVLFEKMHIPSAKKGKLGYSTDAETLEKLAGKYPIITPVLKYRFVSKLHSTFIDGLLKARNPEDGRIHSKFNQCVTATGRISSSEPNLQNIPVRTEEGKKIRKAFVAKPGYVLIDADYSQIELRILAHMSGDENLIHAFNAGTDIHSSTAAEVFGVPLDEVTSEMRRAAKAVNFGIVYGISDFGLSKNLDIPVPEARSYISRYFEKYPKVEAFLKLCVETGKDKGFSATLYGRKRDLPELKSGNYNIRSFGERVAMNMPVQGTAADIIKLAMCSVRKELISRNMKARIVLQVHDELILEAPEEEADEAERLIRECMEGVAVLSVPLVADVHIGESWDESK